MFFGIAPVAARYPQYRLLLSPLTWIFWRIPNHAEWAITRLQAEATRQLETMREQSSSTQMSRPGESLSEQLIPVKREEKPAAPVPIGRYHCISEGRHGNLCVSTQRVSFEIHLTSSERWSLNYKDLKSIEKIVRTSTVLPDDGLLFTDVDGKEYGASGLKLRDEVFSQIIGYSNVRWRRTS